MTEERLAVAKLLRTIIAEDKTALINYDELLAKLKAAGVSGGDYRAIHNALQYKIGSILMGTDIENEAAIKQGSMDLEKTLQANNMLPGRIEFIVDIFTYAMGWQAAEEKLAASTNNAAEDSISAENDANDWAEASADWAEESPQATDERAAWQCPDCGEENDLFFCENCGRAKPEEDNDSSEEWVCPSCSRLNTGKFCIGCGIPKIQAESTWQCPSCGAENTGKFCISCGAHR